MGSVILRLSLSTCRTCKKSMPDPAIRDFTDGGSHQLVIQAALRSALAGMDVVSRSASRLLLHGRPLLQHPLTLCALQVALQHLVHVETLAKSIRKQATAKEKAVAEAPAEGAASGQAPAEGGLLRRNLSLCTITVREC